MRCINLYAKSIKILHHQSSKWKKGHHFVKTKVVWRMTSSRKEVYLYHNWFISYILYFWGTNKHELLKALSLSNSKIALLESWQKEVEGGWEEKKEGKKKEGKWRKSTVKKESWRNVGLWEPSSFWHSIQQFSCSAEKSVNNMKLRRFSYVQ